MEKLGLNEIRKKFIDFYISKGHYPEKSASLIPKNDKSLLIINSGMAPLKGYFSGVETPPSKRMTTCQKCIRTGDIDNVGLTSRHGTFFEMLGNFSFGDYFKRESLTWGWEFITEVLNMPAEKIWVTIYKEDEETYNIWRELGMPDEHIVRLGKEDNFWEIGLGPCGPDSEIFFDNGPDVGCKKDDCKPGCDCDRFTEFWNHVFTQFSKEEDGSYSNLAHPNIDTGMGLERMACIMQGVDSIFDIDTIKYILDGVEELSTVKYQSGDNKADVSIRIITDHLRSMVFMISDNITPSNEGRGYVLRRLIRRAARHGRMIGIKEGSLSKLAERVIKISAEAYPELEEKKEYIKKIIAAEEKQFMSTLSQGETIIKNCLDDKNMTENGELKGEYVFKLYDTYGFPPELTEEILSEHNLKADIDGFNLCMQEQKKKARAGRRSTEESGWDEKKSDINIPDTIFTGYTQLRETGTILAIEKNGNIVDVADEGDEITIYLDKTSFYAEGGGQVSDKGIMSNDNCYINVLNVTKNKGIFSHHCKVKSGSVRTGDNVDTIVDKYLRNQTARNHTATHLLQKALRDTLGNHVQQAGSLVNDKELRFDFNHFQPMTEDEIRQVELSVNNEINSFDDVSIVETDIEKAKNMGAISLFGEKYGNIVRVVSCGNYSVELCGGTHVNNTGQIGAFKIQSETGVASGVRRIVAVTGTGILNSARKSESLINETSDILKIKPNQLKNRVTSLSRELRETKKELEELKQAAMGADVDKLISEAKKVNGVNLITKEYQDLNINDLRDLSDKIKLKLKNTVMIFAATTEAKVTLLISITDDLQEKGFNAGKMIKNIAPAIVGGGGGKADMAQAGGKNPKGVSEAFALAEQLLS